MIFDLNSQESFQNLQHYTTFIAQNLKVGNIVKIMIGNDKKEGNDKEQEAVQNEEIEKFVKENKI